MHRFLFTGVLALYPLISLAQPKPAEHNLSDAILKRLPADYREPAKGITATDPQQARAAQMSDEELTAFAITALGRTPEGAGFLVNEMDKEGSAKLRGAIVQAVGRYWMTHPESQKVGAPCRIGPGRRGFAEGNPGIEASPLVRGAFAGGETSRRSH